MDTIEVQSIPKYKREQYKAEAEKEQLEAEYKALSRAGSPTKEPETEPVQIVDADTQEINLLKQKLKTRQNIQFEKTIVLSEDFLFQNKSSDYKIPCTKDGTNNSIKYPIRH